MRFFIAFFAIIKVFFVQKIDNGQYFPISRLSQPSSNEFLDDPIDIIRLLITIRENGGRFFEMEEQMTRSDMWDLNEKTSCIENATTHYRPCSFRSNLLSNALECWDPVPCAIMLVYLAPQWSSFVLFPCLRKRRRSFYGRLYLKHILVVPRYSPKRLKNSYDNDCLSSCQAHRRNHVQKK